MNFQSLNDFELLRQIGRGTYGRVLLVRSKKNQKLYALKALKKKQILARDIVQQIMTEKQILTSISHPFIVKLYSAFQDTRKLYFLLEYCAGG